MKFNMEEITPNTPTNIGSIHSWPLSFRDFINIQIRQNDKAIYKYKNLFFLLDSINFYSKNFSAILGFTGLYTSSSLVYYPINIFYCYFSFRYAYKRFYIF